MQDRVVTLDGEPPRWPATVRDLLRAASEGGLDRTALQEGLAGDSPEDDGVAARRLAFLERADVFACSDGDCSPGEYGREYLDTHDESVLFEAIAGAANGFVAAMEALAVRPLTGVEVADLLSADLDADVDAATAGRYLAWLRALGYLSREDGVNELTRKGRRLAATTDELIPPGAGADGPADGASVDAAVPSKTTSAADELQREQGVIGAEGGGSADTAPREDLESTGDSALERSLRERYDDACMVCGERRWRGPDAGYAEVHYLMPLGEPHDGPESEANALVVCPNHRADLEHGLISIDPQSLTVNHEYESGVSGRALVTADGHDVGAQYLAYHNDVLAGE